MNEYDVADMQELYAGHAVLGPATATLAALVDWTNAHSDGWAYWGKPRNAARQLIELIGTRRDYLDDPERADATPERYKAALRPLKSFRTRMGKTPIGTGADFPVYDALPAGKSARTFAAELAMQEATELDEAAQLRAQAARELRRRAGGELAEARQVDDANDVLAGLRREYEAKGGLELARLVNLATPGMQVWLMPEGGGAYEGLGHLAESLGMTGPTDRHLVVVKDAEHGHAYNWRRLYPSVVLLPAEAAERWWIVDGAGNLVTGGHADRERMLELAAKQGAPCKVVQGAEFVPGYRDALVPGAQCDECQALIPDAETGTTGEHIFTRHHWPACSWYPATAPAEG